MFRFMQAALDGVAPAGEILRQKLAHARMTLSQLQGQVADRTAKPELEDQHKLVIAVEDAEHALDRIAQPLEHGLNDIRPQLDLP